ncbi:FAD-dependent oxidoreductase [Vitreoscilla massiliensis]|uniref:FAD-dependent oxidoreductase n=1 Tax=Vitreoscilla massiliensis TaxID=1689272 RepID=A0ABY4DX69_9NEIS|nr:FAD-dependent oxidoreductase [Vitreoscilla massiliensis]UOO87902.1 FAD-dependent oxidoreductase [Vitreoscilla massiliensis]
MAALHTSRDTDVLIIGSGASGLAAAVTAAHLGLKVTVIEKTNVVGGTSAFSGGWLWIPHAPHAAGQNTGDSDADVTAYLQAVCGERFEAKMMTQYLQQAPQMLAFFEQNTAVKFLPGSAVPDFFGELAGAKNGWRSVVAAPYDGRGLGKNLAMLRRPIYETTLWGMGIASGADMKHFLHSFKSWSSFYYVGKRISKHGRDLLQYGRSQQIVNGNALVARLLESALRLNVAFVLNARASDIGNADDAGARTVVLDTPQGQVNIVAKRAVVLAAGGFPHDVVRQQQLFPHVQNGTPHHSAAPTTNTGDGLNLGERLGGSVDTTQAASGAWSPVSLVPQADGSWGRFPHLVERGKPGLIAVRANGQRFTNEGGPYHAFVKDMLAATPAGERAVSWLICDHTFIRRYGLGAVKPFPLSLKPWLANGYLKSGNTLAELAHACGIDVNGFETTLRHYNGHAERGQDPEFGRGSNLYQRVAGDASVGPNPCVAPIIKPPFYAVEIVPGSLGTFAGLKTDRHAQVLDDTGTPISGLYAVGNDMNSVMGGHYPSGGITLGPGMTFGYVAARHIAGKQD